MPARPPFARLWARLLHRNQRYRLVFAGSAGAFVRDDLFRLGHIGRPTYVPGDPTATAFNEGKRFMALHVAALLNLPDSTIVERAQSVMSGAVLDGTVINASDEETNDE